VLHQPADQADHCPHPVFAAAAAIHPGANLNFWLPLPMRRVAGMNSRAHSSQLLQNPAAAFAEGHAPEWRRVGVEAISSRSTEAPAEACSPPPCWKIHQSGRRPLAAAAAHRVVRRTPLMVRVNGTEVIHHHIEIAGGVVRPDWEPLRGVGADARFSPPSDPRLSSTFEHGRRMGPRRTELNAKGAGPN